MRKQIYTRLPNIYGTSPDAPVRQDYPDLGFRDGTALPHWRKVIHSGSSATTEMSLNASVVLAAEPADYQYMVKYYWGLGSSDYDTYGPISKYGYPLSLATTVYPHVAGVTAEDEAQALSRIYAKIRSNHYGMNGVLFVGELKETLHMLRHPLAAARKNTLAFLKTLKVRRLEVGRNVSRRKGESAKSLNRRRLNAVKNAMAGTWLEYVFGMLPLISDCKDILETAEAMISGRPPRDRVRARSNRAPVATVQASSLYQYDTELLWGGPTWNGSYLTKTSTKASVQYIVGFRNELSAPTASIEDARRRFGFSLENFIPTLYELAPWSFLIDYFVNLGDILEAACTDLSEVAWCQRTERVVTEQTCVSKDYPTYYDGGGPGFQGDHEPINVTGRTDSLRTVRYTSISRRSASLGIPPLVTSIPGMDSTKWFNMAALLAQARDFRFKH